MGSWFHSWKNFDEKRWKESTHLESPPHEILLVAPMFVVQHVLKRERVEALIVFICGLPAVALQGSEVGEGARVVHPVVQAHQEAPTFFKGLLGPTPQVSCVR